MAAVDELGLRRRTPRAVEPDPRHPSVTVVIPMRNEAAFIGRCLDALQAQDYAGPLEILAVDGRSTDATADLVRSRPAGGRFPVSLLDNPGITTARAMNIGIRASRSDVVIVLGAHSEPAPDFVRRSVEALEASGADCAGGKIDSVATGRIGQAIARAMTSRFGVGGARFRTGGSAGFVDTVAFGAYRRDVVDRVGLFDETLERSDDDEFNYRLRAAGGRIYFDPRIRCRYYTRARFDDLFRQYHDYGQWKIVVARRYPGQMQPRHFVPAAFVGALALSGALALTGRRRPLLVVSATYALAAAAAALRATPSGHRREAPLVAAAFATMHVGYGTGFWRGMWRFLLKPALGRLVGLCPVTGRLVRSRRRS